jgi:hypothetical protein
VKNYNIIFLILFSCCYVFPQSVDSPKPFSFYNFIALGGVNFNSVPTIGGSLQLELQTNLTSSFRIGCSLGYASIFDDNFYEVRGNKFINIGGVEKYQTFLYTVEKVEYSIIPVLLGIEYIIAPGSISPFTVISIGYNFSSSEEIVINYYDGIGGGYDTIEEVPEEYQNSPSKITDGSSITAIFGVGLRYHIITSIDLELLYNFQYNKEIENSNHILFGLVFGL